MKTFGWTFPEMPRTQREKKPRRKRRDNEDARRIGGGILLILVSIFYFSLSDGFGKGLRTYFWNYGTGTVTSNELKKHSHRNGRTVSGSGEVSYALPVEGEILEDTDQVFRRWDWNTENKYEEWAAQYEIDSPVKIFYSDSGETSLGHWPSNISIGFAMQGFFFLGMGLSLIIKSVLRMLAARSSEDLKQESGSE